MSDEVPKATVSGFDPTFMFEGTKGIYPGTADLFVGGDEGEMLARTACCYMRYRSDAGKRYIQGITVIAPPLAAWDKSDEAIYSMVLGGVADMQGPPLSPDEQRQIASMITIRRCQALDLADVLAHIKQTGRRNVILIPAASHYRDAALLAEASPSRIRVLLAEDVWVPHVCRLASESFPLALEAGSVIIFHAPEEPLAKQSSIKALNDVEGLYPMLGKLDDDLVTLQSELIPRWVAFGASGKLTQALEELRSHDLDEFVKKMIELQIYFKAGDTERSLTLLRDFLPLLEEMPGTQAARLGRIAYLAQDFPAAEQCFASALPRVADRATLENSLDTLTSMSSPLIEQCWIRLASLFPQSAMLAANVEDRLLLWSVQTREPGSNMPPRTGFEEFHNFVADALHAKTSVDYGEIVVAVEERWPQRVTLAALCGAWHALTAHDDSWSIQLAIVASNSTDYEPQAIRILLAALRRRLLLETGNADNSEQYLLPLHIILAYLSEHPEEASLRASLVSALSIESAGSEGVRVLATMVMGVLGQGTPMLETPPKRDLADLDRFKEFFQQAFIWMSQQPAVEAGAMRIPAEIMGDDTPELIHMAMSFVRHTAREETTAENLISLEQGAFLVCLMQPYEPEGTDDLEALRLLGALNWLHGRPQRSRDVAEQILAIAGPHQHRKRLAWANYADLFQRTHGPLDALVGLCCAGLNGAPMTPSDLYQETYTLLRITRDLHLYDIARSILPHCRDLCRMLDVGRRGQDRLDGVEISLDVAQFQDLDAAGLLSLLERARVHCERTLESGDEPHSSAAQFLQMAGAAEREGLRLTAETLQLRERLHRDLGPEVALMLKVLSDAAPKTSEVVWLHNRLGAARHSEDTAADQTTAVLAAHRLLVKRDPEISPCDAAVAIEMLSDKAIEIPGAFKPLHETWPAQAMLDYAQQGLAVVMVALDSSDELCAVIAERGTIAVVRPAAGPVHFRQRFIQWTSTYPLRYGLIEREDGTGEFYESMRRLNIPLPNTNRVLIVAQPRLQQIPFNLAIVNDDLAGLSKALGQAPSLTWLESARNRPTNTSNRRHAWISCSPESEAYSTLDMIFARLAPVFEHHGITVNTSGRIPEDLSESKLAIVSAHGQLTSENRYLHRITDENDLAESPAALARALAGVELVILFVCSGGRVDGHPMVNTTVSLPKMLLDRGCRTVIASPWPLAAAVPGNWLERFLERWHAGDTALDAAFAANKYVEQRLGLEPGLCLAMSVYGDVLLTDI